MTARGAGRAGSRWAPHRGGGRRRRAHRRRARRATGGRRPPTRTGSTAASERSVLSRPRASAEASGGDRPPPRGRAPLRAPAAAEAEARRARSRSTPSSRSISAAKESCVSAPLPLARRTRSPRRLAASTPASHSEVLPMPGPPVSTRARGVPSDARSASSIASSASRPTMCPAAEPVFATSLEWAYHSGKGPARAAVQVDAEPARREAARRPPRRRPRPGSPPAAAAPSPSSGRRRRRAPPRRARR